MIDISDPTNPVQIGGVDTDGTANDVKVVGDLAFVADGAHGLSIFTVTNPATPVQVGHIGVGTGSVTIVDTNALLMGSGRLAVIDVSDPTNPVQIGDTYTNWWNGGGWGVDVVGSYAYVAGYADQGCSA